VSAAVSRRNDLREIEYCLRQVGRIGRSREAARVRAEVSGVELSNPSAGILSALHQRGPMRSTALADAADTEAPLVSRELRALAARGFVTNEPDPTDGRARIIALTDDGRAAYEQFRKATDKIAADAFKGWDSEDLEVLAGLLKRVVEDFARPPTTR
jgi:DNA-binding MarR family transcriptional regulator